MAMPNWDAGGIPLTVGKGDVEPREGLEAPSAVTHTLSSSNSQLLLSPIP